MTELFAYKYCSVRGKKGKKEMSYNVIALTLPFVGKVQHFMAQLESNKDPR